MKMKGKKDVRRKHGGMIPELDQFFQGLSVEHLSPLLTDEDIEVVRQGIWLASELTITSKPMKRHLGELLKFKDVHVLYYCIECFYFWNDYDEDDLNCLKMIMGHYEGGDAFLRERIDWLVDGLDASFVSAARDAQVRA
jgi:hypothetical protein